MLFIHDRNISFFYIPIVEYKRVEETPVRVT